MKTLFAIAGFVLSVVLIAGSGFALPRASSVERSQAVERVGFGCNFINGKLVCGKSESSDDNNDEDNHKDADELTECTILAPGGGGGCTTGFKRVCQKLKSGKKCCGCVPEKNAKASQPDKTTTPSTGDAKLDALVACGHACDQDCLAKTPGQEAELEACRISCKSKCPQ